MTDMHQAVAVNSWQGYIKVFSLPQDRPGLETLPASDPSPTAPPLLGAGKLRIIGEGARYLNSCTHLHVCGEHCRAPRQCQNPNRPKIEKKAPESACRLAGWWLWPIVENLCRASDAGFLGSRITFRYLPGHSGSVSPERGGVEAQIRPGPPGAGGPFCSAMRPPQICARAVQGRGRAACVC
jgi:hypothetical protein